MPTTITPTGAGPVTSLNSPAPAPGGGFLPMQLVISYNPGSSGPPGVNSDGLILPSGLMQPLTPDEMKSLTDPETVLALVMINAMTSSQLSQAISAHAFFLEQKQVENTMNDQLKKEDDAAEQNFSADQANAIGEIAGGALAVGMGAAGAGGLVKSRQLSAVANRASKQIELLKSTLAEGQKKFEAELASLTKRKEIATKLANRNLPAAERAKLEKEREKLLPRRKLLAEKVAEREREAASARNCRKKMDDLWAQARQRDADEQPVPQPDPIANKLEGLRIQNNKHSAKLKQLDDEIAQLSPKADELQPHPVVKAKAEISVKQAERAQEDQRRTDCEKAIQTLRDDDAVPNEWNDPSKPPLLPEQRAERINQLSAQMEEHRVNVVTLDQEIGELRGSYLTKADEAAWKQEKLDKEAQRSQEQQRAADCSQHLDNLYRGASNEWDDPAMPPLANAEVRADRIQQVRGQLDVHNANVNRLDEDIAGLDRRLANPVKDEEEEDDTPAGLQKQIDENEEAFDKQRANLQGNMQTVGKMQQDDEKEANFYNMAVQQIVPLAQAAGQLGSGIGSMVAAPDKRDAAESTALSNFDSSQMGIENSTASIYMDAVGNARDTFKSIGEALGNMQQSNQQLGMDLARNMGA